MGLGLLIGLIGGRLAAADHAIQADRLQARGAIIGMALISIDFRRLGKGRTGQKGERQGGEKRCLGNAHGEPHEQVMQVGWMVKTPPRLSISFG